MKRSHVLMLLGILFIVFLFNLNTYISNDKNDIVIFLNAIVSIFVSLTILFGTKKMESKIAWCLFILFVPIIGLLFYMILGVEYNRFKKFDDKVKLDEKIDKAAIKENIALEKIIEKLNNKKDIVKLLYNINHSPITLDNKTTLLTNGDKKYEELYKQLRKAKKFINLEYFIIKEGIILNKILEILYEKAKEGVKIKILYDDFGCVDLSKKILKEIKDNNIEIACFNKIDFKLFRPSINYRNHRKIVVIDNKVGFMGGINIGDEYAHLDKYYGFWRDTHLMIEGSAVRDMNIIFIKDWAHTTDDLLIDEMYYEKYRSSNEKSAVQIIADGPDDERGIIRNTFFKMINEANKRIWITTPYLILDNELMSALKVAALSGIDVRIIVPELHDKGKLLIYKATEAYFSELLNSGVKIYKYKNRFIHSKVLIIDDDVASIGTVNMDYRSFDLHFEVTAILFFDKTIKNMINDFKEDLSNSKEVLWKNWKKRNWFQKTLESIIKIFSPLL